MPAPAVRRRPAPSGLLLLALAGIAFWALRGRLGSSPRVADEPRAAAPLAALAFEVHGRVQGVWFRKFTVEKAQSLRLVGWCANSARGTVVGEAQGPPESLAALKEWLCHEGSPQSRITRCDFSRERDLQSLEFQLFERRANVA